MPFFPSPRHGSWSLSSRISPHRTLNHLTTSASARFNLAFPFVESDCFSQDGHGHGRRGDGGWRRHRLRRAASRSSQRGRSANKVRLRLIVVSEWGGADRGATDVAWRHVLYRFFVVFLSSCRLLRHPHARAPCGATSCHVTRGGDRDGDRDFDRHRDDSGSPSNEREL